MIEVEKKFNLTEEQKTKLLDGAEFLGEKIFTDVYFDTQDYHYTSNDIWIRQRDGAFEVKVPMFKKGEERIADQYEELEDDIKIKDFLGFNAEGELVESLKYNKIEPFCRITTKRQKYKKDRFIIDIDEMDFGFKICEIELMVENYEDIKNAEQEIIAFAKRFDLMINYVRGKVLEYLKINNQEHLKAIENKFLKQ